MENDPILSYKMVLILLYTYPAPKLSPVHALATPMSPVSAPVDNCILHQMITTYQTGILKHGESAQHSQQVLNYPEISTTILLIYTISCSPNHPEYS